MHLQATHQVHPKQGLVSLAALLRRRHHWRQALAPLLRAARLEISRFTEQVIHGTIAHMPIVATDISGLKDAPNVGSTIEAALGYEHNFARMQRHFPRFCRIQQVAEGHKP